MVQVATTVRWPDWTPVPTRPVARPLVHDFHAKLHTQMAIIAYLRAVTCIRNNNYCITPACMSTSDVFSTSTTKSSPQGQTRSGELREEICQKIEEDIATGVLRPGARLDEAELAARFSISRTPVREAFIQLAAVGILDLRPRRGAVVPELSPRRLIEMIEVMAELEAMCGRLAARRMSRISGTSSLRTKPARTRKPAGMQTHITSRMKSFTSSSIGAATTRFLASERRGFTGVCVHIEGFSFASGIALGPLSPSTRRSSSPCCEVTRTARPNSFGITCWCKVSGSRT